MSVLVNFFLFDIFYIMVPVKVLHSQNIFTYLIDNGQHSGAVVPYSKKVVGTIPFLCVSACSPCLCVGSSWVLKLPPTVQKHARELNWEF